jgi:hypothetical protein
MCRGRNGKSSGGGKGICLETGLPVDKDIETSLLVENASKKDK